MAESESGPLSQRLYAIQTTDLPTKPSYGWNGYQHYIDPTLMPVNQLTYPSKNVLMPARDKIILRGGSQVIGPEGIIGDNIFGHCERFANKAGLILEVRVFQKSGGFQYEALYIDPDTGAQQWVEFKFDSSPTTQGIANITPLNGGGMRMYFTGWWDNVALTQYLIWCSGDYIGRWTGGLGKIASISGNNLTLAGGVTWASIGFDGGAGGTKFVMINGVQKTVTGDFSTDTITIDSVVGVSVGDIVADWPQTSEGSNGLGNKFGYCSNIKNHVVYGIYISRQEYASNAINYDSLAEITNASAVQNDLIIADAASYTGTSPAVLQLSMTNVTNPASESFTPGDTTGGDTAGDNLVIIGTYDNPVVQNIVIVCTSATDVNVFVNGVSVATGVVMATYPSAASAYTIPGGSGVQVYWVPVPGSHIANSGWQITFGGSDLYNVTLTVNGTTSTIATNVSASTVYTYEGVEFSFASYSGHTTGDTWTVSLEQSVTEGWQDFYETAPTRKPGQAFTFYLPSNFWSMMVQEDVMYINDQGGNWVYVQLTLSSDLETETVSVTPLKQNGSSKLLFPYMYGYTNDFIVYVTDRHYVEMIGRKKFLQLPQTAYLSDPVKLDFDAASFVGGSIEYWDKKLFFTSPAEQAMFVYDDVRKYWQPPQDFPENGILTQIGNGLASHSPYRNQTNILFVGLNDNGAPFTTKIRTGFQSGQNPYKRKEYNMTFIQGYMNGNPKITYSIIRRSIPLTVVEPHIIVPEFSKTPDLSPFGEDPLGNHPFGSGNLPEPPMFWEVFPDSMKEYLYAAFDLECNELNQDWSILMMALNNQLSRKNNSDMQNQTVNDYLFTDELSATLPE